jgi:hypothetical protein
MANIIFSGGNAAGSAPPPISVTSGLCSALLGVVSQQLQDVTGITWDATAVLLPYLNMAVKEIANKVPESSPASIDVPLLPGVRQALPPGSIFLIDAEGNISIDGSLQSAIRIIAKEVIDSALPDWRVWPTNDEVLLVARDERNPLTYYTFPPQPVATTRRITLVISSHKPDVTDVSQPFPLPLAYVPAAINYVIYMALREETTIPGAQAKSAACYQQFMQDLGIGKNVRAKNDAKGV